MSWARGGALTPFLLVGNPVPTAGDFGFSSLGAAGPGGSNSLARRPWRLGLPRPGPRLPRRRPAVRGPWRQSSTHRQRLGKARDRQHLGAGDEQQAKVPGTQGGANLLGRASSLSRNYGRGRSQGEGISSGRGGWSDHAVKAKASLATGGVSGRSGHGQWWRQQQWRRRAVTAGRSLFVARRGRARCGRGDGARGRSAASRASAARRQRESRPRAWEGRKGNRGIRPERAAERAACKQSKYAERDGAGWGE